MGEASLHLSDQHELSCLPVGKQKLVDLERIISPPVLIFNEPRLIIAKSQQRVGGAEDSNSYCFPSMTTLNFCV